MKFIFDNDIPIYIQLVEQLKIFIISGHIKPGERIPLDGIIIEGEASLDTSALTGESKYYDVKANDKVLSGSININGHLKIRVTKLYNESMVSKIVDMVSNASLKKANTEKRARIIHP